MMVRRPSRTPTAAANALPPLPSTIVPFSMTTSYGSAIGCNLGDVALERGSQRASLVVAEPRRLDPLDRDRAHLLECVAHRLRDVPVFRPKIEVGHRGVIGVDR